MIQRLLFFIAGVDRKIMLECPATDRMWASHIGFSLCLSFTVVLGVSFLATGYMIDNLALRSVLALVIATTVFMFDRALFQSDWFVQGAFHADDDSAAPPNDPHRLAGRFLRVAARLTISLGLAWVIALFLELALFSDTIRDRIERDRIAINQPVLEQIAKYEVELDHQIAARAAAVSALEQKLLAALAERANLGTAPARPSDETGETAKAWSEREDALRSEIRDIEQQIQQQSTNMNAEEFGQKLSASNTGRAGQGPRYEFAKRQKEALEATLQSRNAELARIVVRQQRLSRAEAEQTAAAVKIEDEARAALAARRATLRSQVDTARQELQRARADKGARLDEFRRDLLERTYVQAKTDAADPLTRISAYQALKDDPEQGRTITLFSWMTRWFIVFLEIVPIIAKIFFFPPSVYALRVQAEIKRARQGVRRMMDQPDVEPKPPAPDVVFGRLGASFQPSTQAQFRTSFAYAAGPRTAIQDQRNAPSMWAGWWNRITGERRGDFPSFGHAGRSTEAERRNVIAA